MALEGTEAALERPHTGALAPQHHSLKPNRHSCGAPFQEAAIRWVGWDKRRGARAGDLAERAFQAFPSPEWPGAHPQCLGLCAVRIQAFWRGSRVRRRILPFHFAHFYVHVLVRSVRDRMTQRMQSKAFIRARNRKIDLLRSEIAKSWGWTPNRQALEDELFMHLRNNRHQLRARILLQAWWRGCRVRGWRGRSVYSAKQSHPPHENTLASFLDGPRSKALVGQAEDTPEVWGSFSEGVEWPDMGRLRESLPSLSAFTSYLWADSECYEKTRVRRIPVPDARTFADGRPRRIRIFFSDTGGGHRASALALQAALERQYPGQVCVRLVDFLREATGWPWYFSPELYAALGHMPSVYKKVYDHEKGHCSWSETMSFGLLWRSSRASVLQYLTRTVVEGVDLVISVHPLINHLVMEAFDEIFHSRNIVPVVTVVTDLGTAHLSWFDPRVDLVFVPSDEIRQLAHTYRVPRNRICLCGLPVREGFWQPHPWPKSRLREHLGLAPTEEPEVVLLMGGGEGFGSLSKVAIAIGERLARMGHGQLVVICGRNDEARKTLQEHKWPQVTPRNGAVWRQFVPQVLGFVHNVHEYMGAADCLVTKAGPGSIAEAMISGLPCLITSYLPGQEEGNVRFVTGAGAGDYVSDQDPERVADTVVAWIRYPQLLARTAQCARGLARPRAALDIARRICEELLGFGVELTEQAVGAAARQGSDDGGLAEEPAKDAAE